MKTLNKKEKVNYKKPVKRKSKVIKSKHIESSLVSENKSQKVLIQKLQKLAYNYCEKMCDIIESVVYNYPTKYKEGFIQEEIDGLLKMFPPVHLSKFQNAMDGNTCMLKDKDIAKYHNDVHKAIVCGLENRNLTVYERD